jgi:hypothetical protein
MGASADYDLELLNSSSPIEVSDPHLMLSVRAQMALVRVDFWSAVEMRSGVVLFDGEIDLPDGRLYVRDVDELVWCRFSFGPRGRQRITVAVDYPGSASRVWVISGQGRRADEGYFDGDWFGGVAPSVRQPSVAELLEYYLADHDSPAGRLSAAMMLLVSNPERSEHLRQYNLVQVREWLSGLSPALTQSDCVRATERIAAFVTAGQAAESAGRFAGSVIDELTGRR